MGPVFAERRGAWTQGGSGRRGCGGDTAGDGGAVADLGPGVGLRTVAPRSSELLLLLVLPWLPLLVPREGERGSL